MDVALYGLCVINDKYFEDFPSIRHMSNKHEARPYYLAVREENGIIWVIPLSSRVDKYRAKIAADEEKHRDSIFYYISRIKGSESVFLIGNVIPVTADYVKKPFTVSGKPFVIENSSDIKKIKSKLSRYLTMVRRGMLHPAVDILSIERALKNRVREAEYII